MRRSLCRWIHSYSAVRLTTKPMPPPAVARHAVGELTNDAHESELVAVGEVVFWSADVVLFVVDIAPGGNLVSSKGAFIV